MTIVPAIRRFRGMAAAALFLPLLLQAQPATPDSLTERLDNLSWLAGYWISADGNARTEEVWLAPAGGQMVGVNRQIREDGRSAFEFLRIAIQGDSIVYLAAPGGRAPTPFTLVEQRPGEAVFANSGHDFPQRIIYEQSAPGRLTARIEGRVEGVYRSARWQFTRKTLPTHP